MSTVRGGVRGRGALGLLAVLVLAMLPHPPTAALVAPAPQELLPSVVGQWTAPATWPVQATHLAVLPTGKVLLWANHNNVRLWDPATGTLADQRLGGTRNIFCSGHTLLADGRLLVVSGLGGAGGSSTGHRHTHLYDPVAQRWSQGPDMAAGRWYPGVVGLADGRVLAIGGNDEEADANKRVEIYTPGQGWAAVPGADRQVSVYARMHLLPDGTVARTGPEAATLFFDPATGAWRNGPTQSFGHRGGGASVLLPGLDKVLAFGGQRQGSVTNTAEILDLSGTPQWRGTAAMAFPRMNLVPLLLADGSVLALGGSPGTSKSPSVLAPERFDPATETWSALAPAQRGRTYHSTAALLPDGRVLVAGSDVELVDGAVVRLPVPARTAEVFSPPYLFKGPRPVIAAAPARVAHGETFAIESPDAAAVARVALVKLGTTTHTVGFDQRHVGLAFTVQGTALAATVPANPAAAPPGHYMLFLLDAQGVPSVARMVRVG